ncbi:PD-(D/E)XK nuclease family protein [Brachyspira sp. SAP_772]|uniref:PDDEXK-like family protein n=1 Tax=Brachyspira sp. SAP_772 TaxID=2608385 RepID=UPI0012F497ED|nr:PD-(D/E)XK nuclease family protein [Brachyspira sp. SAP_772]
MNTEIIENRLLTLTNEFKKDEEEKYNSVSNTIKSIHKSFLEEEELKTNRLNEIFSKIKIIIEKVKNEMKKFPPQFCIFDVVNLQRHENYNSDLIAKLLEVNIKYKEDTELSFVKDFLMYLNNKFNWSYGFNDIKKLKHSDIIIKREEYAGTRRIDLFISYKKDFAIIIENKISAGEQYNQLEDYYNSKKDNYKNLYMIFLTPSGYEPSTLSEESKKELGNNFQTLKHSDIALWLENILENEKYSFLHDINILFKDNDNKYIKDYRLLKSAMIQTIHNANMLSNNTKELDMTKGKIQELLKKHLFQDIQTVEDAEEYKQIFNSVIDIINEKKIDISLEPILFFTDKVIKYLNENSDDKSYYYKKIDEITKHIKENPYSKDFCHNIKYNLNNYNADILLEYHYESGTFQFSIYTYNEKSYKKLKNKESSIKEIFSNFEEANPYVYYIDTEKDSPEEIAEAMIKLYNLLKENL